MIVIQLPATPDLSLVGGNARPGHFMQRARWAESERQKWTTLLLEAGFKERTEEEGALMEGPVLLSVEVVFREERGRDIDNLTIALKPLADVLEVSRVVRRGSDIRRWAVRGFGGLIRDDQSLQWEVKAVVDRSRAPLTIIHLSEKSMKGT